MSSNLPFVSSNTLATYVYEPFSYTLSNPLPGTYTLTISNTPGIPPGYLVNNGSNVVFSTTSNAMSPGTTEVFVVTASSNGTVVGTCSNIVKINVGRFLNDSGNSYVGSNFTFYKNEPIAGIPLVAPITIGTPTSTITLPPGLTYVSNAPNKYTISGTPLVTAPLSNYTIIGKGTGSNAGKTVTSTFGLSVSNERVLLNLAGSSIVSPMTVGTPISTRTITAQFPPYTGGGTLRYTWSGLPDGISVIDVCGNSQGSPFTPFDPAYTLNIQGAPTITAANAYRTITSNTVTFTATRTNPLPVISNTLPITFGFGETVLFDTPYVPILYSGVTLDPSAIFFHAQTYFGTGSAISNIFSPDLRSDLSINFVASSARGYLTGTPGALASATYTIRAINSNGISRDVAVPITVTTDTVTFVSPTPNPVDACFNFVLSRPSSLALTGYYTSNIQFKAVASSGNAISFTSSGLNDTGLSLSNVGSSTVQLVGTPTTVTPLTTATITANVSGTPATASTTFKFEVLNDVITFSQPTPTQLSFIQNRAITPIQITATTLSERPVISFTSSNLPAGLTISTTGLITGTPTVSTSGSFTVTASTGYMSQTETYGYTLTPDSIILIERPQPSYSLTLGGPIPPAKVSGLSYSGIAVSNFVFNSLPVTYGLTIDANTGIFGGTLTTSYPPDPVLPSNVSFNVQGSAGSLTSNLPVQLNTSNAARYQWFLAKGANLVNAQATLDNWSLLHERDAPSYTDYSIRPIDVNSRAIVGVTHSTGFTYSSNGSTFTDFTIPETPWPFYDVSGAPFVEPGFSLNLGPKVIVRSGTTLYGTGYDVPVTQIGSFWKSTNDGQTWTSTFPLLASGVLGRSWLPNAVSYGNAIAFKSGVLLIGGNGDAVFQPSIIRSTNDGNSWAGVSGATTSWVTNFNTDAFPWIVAGSDDYFPGATYSVPSRTLRYSTDQGATWSLVTSGDFNYFADFVIYGNGVWIAGGREYNAGDGYIYFGLRTSTDGLTWTTFTLPGTWYPVDPTFIPALGQVRSSTLDSMLFDGDSFIVGVTQNDDGSLIQSFLTHPADGSSLSSGWTTVSSGTLSSFAYNIRPIQLRGRLPVATLPPQPVLFFPSQAINGPTITSPTVSSLLLYQYAAMTPLTFSATGTGRVYFFVQDSQLPRGVTFNSVTNTLSGTPMLLGNYSLTIYAKDNNGISILDFEIRVIIATVERQQTSAGAWTSLVRQYTVVNAAQNSVNGRTLPATEPPLGEFMRPPPPDSVSAPGDPNCEKC